MSKLQEYGTEVGLTADTFPDAIDPEFFEAWATYISTQTAYELFNSLKQPLGQVRLVQGFLSSIAPIASRPTLRPVTSPYKETMTELKNYCKRYRVEVNQWLERIQFLQMFRLADVKVRIDSSKNIVANCLNYSSDVYLTYVPKPVNGNIPNVGQILHQQAPFWFKGREPAALFKTDNLTKKLKASAHKVEYDTYPRLPQLMASNRAWHPWNEQYGVDVARVHGNAVVIHLQLPRKIVFLMRKTQQEAERQIIKTIKTVFV